MIRLRIRLTPMEPYFLGGERCDMYGTFITQQAAINPYFLKSGRLPSQSALFGILRYLGIRHPQSDYSIDGSKDYIGGETYNLIADNQQQFGKIMNISELLLMDENDDYWCMAPQNHVFLKDSGIVEYDCFESISTLAGKRYLPVQYKEKNEGTALFVRLTSSSIQKNQWLKKNKWLKADDVFGSTIQVGINRSRHNTLHEDQEKSGFFKREYAFMKQGYSFVFFAELDDNAFGEDVGFTKDGSCAVSVGRYHAMFMAEWSVASERPEIKDSIASYGFEKEAVIKKTTDEGTPQSERKKLFYAWALSDTVHSGEMSELREACVLMIGSYREQRVFTTNYKERSAIRRYSKDEKVLKLISAGTVFLFDNENQQKQFQAKIESDPRFNHGLIAGYNRIYYSGKE